MIWIGIDPGLDGAVCVYDPRGPVTFFDTPTLATGKGNKREYDIAAMANILRVCTTYTGYGYEVHAVHAAIERSQAMSFKVQGREQGVASSFRTGYGYGIWLGILAALRIPYEAVAPVSWKKKMLFDMPKGKDSSIIKAKQLFPAAADDLKRKKDHGRAEALLIMEFVRRRQEVVSRVNQSQERTQPLWPESATSSR